MPFEMKDTIAALPQIEKTLQGLGITVTNIQPLIKGGSARLFFRVHSANKGKMIFVAYDDSKEENALYAPLAIFLRANNIDVPVVFFHDQKAGYLIMEDLGDEDLYSQREAPLARRLDLYKQVLREIHKLHCLSDKGLPRVMPPFAEATFRWEREYFWEQFVRPFVLLDASAEMPTALVKELTDMAQRLLVAPRSLLHRDCQSQNVLLYGEKTYLIDFQGMRWGNPLYDVASLLFDPYVTLEDSSRTMLFGYYRSLFTDSATLANIGEEMLYEAALARLLQALGAYGFLSYRQGKRHFAEHIPRALANLAAVLEKLPRYEQLTSFIMAIDKDHLHRQIRAVREGGKGNDAGN